MRKKQHKNILTLHKKLKHPIILPMITGKIATLQDGTEYDIQEDGSWRKRKV